jgi:thioredoxin 1
MIDLNEENFDEFIKDGTVVVDFWAEWCGPCKMLTPILEELDNEMEDIKFAKIDADANVNLAADLGVNSIPSIFVFRNGEPLAKQIGAKPKVLMRKFIEDAVSQ